MAGPPFLATCVMVTALVFTVVASADNNDHGWDFAHATFYGDMNGGETMLGFSRMIMDGKTEDGCMALLWN
ncbi:hypothetical protein L1049_003741 [Liquidambar formosana]|uniref:Uncharacterized protein n=1 Tax=Liquidambar formosana TaxID=63359 RepID=A0AAP0RM57_LIQFO